MPQFNRVIDYIREMKREGKLIPLIQANIIHVKTASWVDIYNMYDSRIAINETKAEAVRYCTQAFRMNKRTVYNIINQCEQEVIFSKLPKSL